MYSQQNVNHARHSHVLYTMFSMARHVHWKQLNSRNYCIDSNQILLNAEDQQVGYMHIVDCTPGRSLLSVITLCSIRLIRTRRECS